jgi:hypothetical protein
LPPNQLIRLECDLPKLLSQADRSLAMLDRNMDIWNIFLSEGTKPIY